jgi:hypothetical protein
MKVDSKRKEKDDENDFESFKKDLKMPRGRYFDAFQKNK